MIFYIYLFLYSFPAPQLTKSYFILILDIIFNVCYRKDLVLSLACTLSSESLFSCFLFFFHPNFEVAGLSSVGIKKNENHNRIF